MLPNTLRRWFTGDMGTPGEYMYQSIHLWTVTVVAALFLFTVFAGHRLRHNTRTCRKLLTAIALFQLFFEIFWRLVYVFIKGDSLLCWWPVYPCNLGGVLIPVLALCDWQKGKKMFYLFGFVGGALTFAYPQGIFTSDALSFPILKSILQHTGLLLIPALEYVSGRYRPSLRDLGWVVSGSFIHIFNCEVITRLWGFTGDYIFFRSGLPFVLPGVPQFVTLSVFAFFVLALLCFLCDAKSSLACLKRAKEAALSN